MVDNDSGSNQTPAPNTTATTTATTTAKAAAEAIHALTRALPASLRRLRVDVLAETLANGVPVHPTALTVVLAAHVEAVDVPLVFTRDHVEELLWFEVSAFCDDHELRLPAGCGPALHAVLSVLVRTGRLTSGSDSTPELFAPFAELGCLARAG